ncbi:DUF6147 family protein [Sporosarcina sp. FSL K6-2383]|uniref:DUF6147 family protein n=1 Tax=Sporosarcina sp. FSL K6-2383 TaxID=2921556 RepID=UPI00315AE311
MKLLNRAILLLLFAIVTMGWIAHDSLAAEKESISTISPKVILTDYSGDKSENIYYDITPFATQYVRSGQSLIELLPNSTTLRVSGSTNAYISVNTIKITLLLQQWSPAQSKWLDAVTIGPESNYSSNSVSYSKQVKVSAGYSYRIKAQHDVIHNGVFERLTSISNQVYVN